MVRAPGEDFMSESGAGTLFWGRERDSLPGKSVVEQRYTDSARCFSGSELTGLFSKKPAVTCR